MTLTWYPVVTFPLEKNLMPLLSLLQQKNIQHHVTEERGEQQLWISEKVRIAEIAQLSRQWARGELKAPEKNSQRLTKKPSVLFVAGLFLKLFPVNTSLILLALLGTLLVYFSTNKLTNFSILLFQPFVQGAFLPFSTVLERGEYWRLITPIFLHFSFFHFLFNVIILWAMGGRIERAKGSIHYLMLVLIVAIISNTAQYFAQANTIFGGMSGVVYGIVGYIAVYQSFIFHPVLQFNRAMIGFFIVWMALGFTGIIDNYISGSIANFAHLAGLLTGAIIGAWFVWLDKKA